MTKWNGESFETITVKVWFPTWVLLFCRAYVFAARVFLITMISPCDFVMQEHLFYVVESFVCRLLARTVRVKMVTE